MTVDLAAAGVIPLFNHPHPAVAAEVVAACAAGGATVIEITDRAPGTEAAIAAAVARLERHGMRAVVGAGSVVDAERAGALLEAGAGFVVSPGLSEPVARECERAGVPYLPGCATPSEVVRARQLGLGVTKIFPASALGGPGYLAALRAAMPWLCAVPTGGVRNDPAEIAAYVRAGAASVGLGSDLVSRASLDAGDWPGLTRAVERALAAVRAARAEAAA